ncbi:MAG: acyl-CoA dehydrogenase family protein [Egibacteraceae bacterium]
MTVDGHPLVAAATRVADEVLAPAAEQVDGLPLLPRGHLDALAQAGLMGLYGPGTDGGQAAPGPIARRCQQLVAAACGATFFTWAQHHSPLRLVAGAPDGEARRRWLRSLCTGEVRAGVAFAYLRRPGPPAVRASPAGDGGWVLEGAAPWVTGWGLVDVIFVVAGCDDGRKVLCLVPVEARGLLPEPLELMVFQCTGTVRLGFAQVAVSAGQVVDVWPDERWQQVDRVAAAQPIAAPFGITERCVQGLRSADRPGGSLAREAAAALAKELSRCHLRVDELDQPPPEAEPELTGWLEALTTVRDWSIDLANRAAQAWVAAVGGRAMSRSHPAQRLVREAAFYLIQAQTGELRRAELARLARPGDPQGTTGGMPDTALPG